MEDADIYNDDLLYSLFNELDDADDLDNLITDMDDDEMELFRELLVQSADERYST